MIIILRDGFLIGQNNKLSPLVWVSLSLLQYCDLNCCGRPLTEIIRDFCRYILIVENQLLSLMYCFVMFCFVLIITVNMSLVVALVKGRIFFIIWCLREEKPNVVVSGL